MGFVAAIGSLAIRPLPAGGHTPHDDVFGMAVSPTYAADGTVIVIARGIAYRSVDGAQRWERLVVGLDNRNPLTSAAVTCCDSPTYLVASPGDGVYRSDDGGSHWARANAGLASRQVTRLAASPAEGGPTFAVADEVLFRSDDAGISWTSLDHPGAPITSIGLSSSTPDEVLIGDAEGRVHRSDDLGRTWATVRATSSGAVDAITRISSDEVLVGTDAQGLLRSVDDLASFEQVAAAALDSGAVASVATSSTSTDAADLIWVSLADDGAVRSGDGGASWQTMRRGLTKSTQADEAGYEDRDHFGDVVVAPGSTDEGPTVFLAGFDGLFVLDPGATTWREAELMRSQIVVGLAVSPDYANDRSVAVTTYMNGASLSTDGGDSWRSINAGLEEDVLYRSGEDRFARLFGIAFSPDFVNDRRLVAARWTDMLTSSDAGGSWTSVKVIPGEKPPLQQFAFTLTSDSKQVIALTGSRDGLVHRSTDGGRRYEAVGELDGTVRSIVAIDDADSSTFLAATQRGIFVSEDAGSEWSPLTRNVRNTTNLAVSPAFAEDGIAFAATREGLFTTRDGGATWSVVSAPTPLQMSFIEGVAVAPTFGDDGLVLASARGHGLYRSTDGGRSFLPVGRDLGSAQLELSNYSNATAVPIVFSPTFARDRTVFGYSNTTVVRSVDAGTTWKALDLPRAVHRQAEPAEAAPTLKPDREPADSDTGPDVVAVTAVAVLATGGATMWWWRRRRHGSSTELR